MTQAGGRTAPAKRRDATLEATRRWPVLHPWTCASRVRRPYRCPTHAAASNGKDCNISNHIQ
eukprot:3993334-Amphidinium_carterae.2